MTDERDIVERLRHEKRVGGTDEAPIIAYSPLGEEAATEILRLRAELAKARDVALEEAIAACAGQSVIFGTDQYAIGQPLSSFPERFACERCMNAIHTLKGTQNVV